MNIADYCINGLPKIGKWHDMHIHLEGDAVRYLQGIFLTMWNRETGQHIGGPAYFPDTAATARQYCRGNSHRGPHPRETPRSISHAYAASIQAAQKVSDRESLFRSDEIHPQGNQERTEKRY